MPNRLIYESLRTSDSVNRMTDFQFRLWISLITFVDDYGRGDARPAVIKGSCFPLRERITLKDISTALAALADTGCVSLYEVDGRPYLYFPEWEKYQRVRQRVSKYPEPGMGTNGGERRQSAATCGNPPQSAATCGNLRPESNPIQSESESNPNPNVGAEPETDSPQAKAAFRLPLNNGEYHTVTETDIAQWSELYPAVDVAQEIRKMIGWLEANPSRRKTPKGVRAFINNWLSKEQDRGHRQAPAASKTAEKVNWATNYQQREYTDEDLNKYYTDLSSYYPDSGGETK